MIWGLWDYEAIFNKSERSLLILSRLKQDSSQRYKNDAAMKKKVGQFKCIVGTAGFYSNVAVLA